MEKNTPWFLHVDLDAFFASVEQLDHPEYKGKPVIVGGKPEDKRSVVSTASYEARKFGVHSAMPTYQAYKLCPQGIYVYGRMKRYAELSYQIMSIFREYSPDVIQMSIDEAFIDLTGTEKLFGPPEETAMKIKAHVKKNTGLTVSVGLAPTKYLAKIASGFNKPDGFYFVKPGTEQEFMLNLPLDKVWGVGKKTLESLKKSGIRSTRDIYEKSYDSLEFMFGKNMGNFLYNVVRGIDVVSFGAESKKHSISTENTFPYDIYDTYTAETQLLDLCHDVMFRLIRKNEFSRTVFVKIRYDDFSTVSIQETTDRNILTVDRLFEVICNLFEKKYEPGREIRLLGVGFDNIEKEDRPYQQDLFDFGSEKKQAVEKAILNLEKKHPDVRIRKARLLNKNIKSIILALLWSTSVLLPGKNVLQNVFSEEVKKSEMKGAGTILPGTPAELPKPNSKDEDEEALFSWDINDNEVDLLLSGYWLFSLSNVLNFSFGNNTGFRSSFGLPVFKQEVDFSTLITLNKTWYFQADFADQFEKNTLAMGYNGNGYIKSARLSNREITMPANYSANYFGYGLSGGNNQAPGLSIHFADIENSRWSGDVLFRYDMTKTNNATFYGKNSVTDTEIDLSNFVYGKSFVLPLSAADDLWTIKEIFVQDTNGSYTDKNGYKYRKLNSSDYLILHSSCRILFNNSANTQKKNGKIPTILVTFSNTNSVDSIITKTGSYSDTESFAGKIQTLFTGKENSNVNYNLTEYTHNLSTTVNGEKALILQSSVFFSPYLCANIYDCGITTQADVFIQNKTTKLPSSDYYAEQYITDSAALTNDFILENHYYAQVSNSKNSDSDTSLQNPNVRFPLASTFPGIYLNTATQTDCELILRNYNKVSSYEIGTDAVGGTVQVYINNILDSSAVYNAETGIVELSKTVSDTDKVYIIWQEDASNLTGGAVAAAAGLYFNFTPSLTFDFAITTRWPISLFENYSTPDNLVTGFTAITSGISYTPQNFKIEDKVALSLNSPNATENLIAVLHEDSGSQTYYLGNCDGFATKNEPVLTIKKNGITQKINLIQTNNKTSGGHGGITDSEIKGYKIPVSWDFNEVNITNALGNYNGYTPFWSAADIHLSSGELLKNSSALEIALQSAIPPDSTNDYEVYLQLGISATEDFSGEYSDSIPTWKLTGFDDKKVLVPFDTTSSQWQTVIISLSDSDRARLSSDCDARLVIVYKPSETNTVNSHSGTVYFGPYEPHSQSLFITENSAIKANTYTVSAMETPGAKKLKMSQCFATKLSWNIENEEKAKQDSVIFASTYFSAADFSNYKYLNLDFDTSLCGQIDLSLSSNDNEAVHISIADLSKCIIPLENTLSTPAYHTLTVNITEKTLSIDGVELDPSLYDLKISTLVIPNKFTIQIDTSTKGQNIANGVFYVGNLYFTECHTYMNIQNYFHAEYEKQGTIAKIGDYEAVKDAVVKLHSTQSLNKIDGSAQGGITLTDIRYEADFDSNLNGGHAVHTKNPLFNIVSFGESYRFNHSDQTLNKKDDFEISYSNPYVPFKIDFTTDGKDFYTNQSQNANAAVQIQAITGKVKTGIETTANVEQKINKTKTSAEPFNTNNYFKGWYDISALQFSTGKNYASSRTQDYNAVLYTELPFLSIRPEFSYRLNAMYQNIAETTLTDVTELSYTQPLSFDNNSFNFSYKRSGIGEEQHSSGGSYISDFSAISKSFTKRKFVYTAIPFYDLFDKKLSQNINSNLVSDSQTYSTVYSLNWKRKLMNNWLDFLVPSSSGVDFSREIKTGITQSDLYQIKGVISNTALNCFGSQSKLAFFNWYTQDEFISSITGTVKIPLLKSEQTTFAISAYDQILFLISETDSLKTGIDFSLETTLDWNIRATSIYSRNGTSSFITDIIKHFSKKDDLEIKILRKETLNLSAGQKDKILHQQYEFLHSTDFSFLKYYSITTGIGAVFSTTQNTASNLGLNLNIGGKIEF